MKNRGFVDIQVNGYLGVEFSGEGLTLADVRRVTLELLKRGTAAYCPAVVEGPEDMFRSNLEVLAAAMRESDLGKHLLGIHLEGPFLSPEPGARGAHRTEFLKEPSIEFFERCQGWAEGRIVLLTLAPELPGAEELIRHATSHGVVVAIGHSHAGADALERAVKAGATCSTHLGNGIAETINRHHNPIWWQLACDDLYSAFVTDGHHLPPELIRTAWRAKGADRFIATSDAAGVAGLPPGEHMSRGRHLVIAPNGRTSLAGTNYLAGSSSCTLDCMNHLASLGIMDEADLWKAGLHNALALFGKTEADVPGVDECCVEFDGERFTVLHPSSVESDIS